MSTKYAAARIHTCTSLLLEISEMVQLKNSVVKELSDCIHLTIYKLGSRQSHGHNINNFPTSNEMHLFCVLNIFLQIFWVALI